MVDQPGVALRGDGAPTPSSLDALRQQLEGGAFIVCCRHPDIDNGNYGIGHPMRQCVLDAGDTETCDQSASDAPHPITEKTNCPYWLPRQFKRPQRISIADAKWLISELEAARAGPRVATGQLRADPLPQPKDQDRG